MLLISPITLMSVLLLWPTWRIFDKAGLTPLLSLFVLIPFCGFFIVLIILSFAKWSNIDERRV